MDSEQAEKAGRPQAELRYCLLRKFRDTQNHEMLDKAEDLRDEYYLIKMTPRPKVVKKVVAQEEARPAEQG